MYVVEAENIGQIRRVIKEIDDSYQTGECDGRQIACPICEHELVYTKIQKRKVKHFATCTNSDCNFQVR